MTTPLIEGAGSQRASTQTKGNRSTTTSIGCVEVSAPMTTELMLSHDDKKYIRERLAEGIARALVEKVAKNTASAVDKSEPERYTHSPLEKGGTFS